MESPVLVSFGSSNLRPAIRRFRLQAKLSGLFSEIRVFSEDSLDQNFREEFGSLLNASTRGFGYWLWKPQIVLQTINSLPRGTPVLYLDLGCHLRPFMTFDWGPIIELCRTSPSGLVGFQDRKKDPQVTAMSSEAVWTKGDLFDHFEVRLRRDVYETPQFAAAAFFLTADPRSRRFLMQWLSVARQGLHLFDDTPSVRPNFPEFREHRHDQSVFSLLCKTMGCSRLPQDLLQARRFSPGDATVTHLPFVAARDLSGFPRNLFVWVRVVSRLVRGFFGPKGLEIDASRMRLCDR